MNTVRLVFCAFAAAAFSLQNLSAKTLVFLGDSLTAGYGLAEERSYPALIQKSLQADGLDWTVVNAGISGDTSQGGLKRLPWILKSKPDVVFVALGANDGLRGFKTAATQSNLDRLIASLKKEGVRVVLTGLQLPSNYGAAYRREFKKIYENLAQKHRLPFYPFLLEGVAARPELNLPDGIHPNEAGQAVIAERLYVFMKPLLQ